MIKSLLSLLIGLVCSFKGIALTIFGASGFVSALKGNEKCTLEISLIMTLLLGAGLLNIWVVIGWITESDGVEMRRRRMLAWKSEMFAGISVLVLYKVITSRSDFGVGHGQEAYWLYILVAFVTLLAAQFNLISYSIEKV